LIIKVITPESPVLDFVEDTGSMSDELSLQLRKIFVGGLPHNLPLDIFRNYFDQFGKLDDCLILQDKRTNKPRGFGFVTYNTVEEADRVMELKDKHVIHGKWVECKRAVALE
jgi:RNA recognition motif-containing protein